MKHVSGSLVATTSFVPSLAVAELCLHCCLYFNLFLSPPPLFFLKNLCLRVFAPVPDPYDKYKHGIPPNPYIKFEFPANYRLETQAEEGLPGVQGHNRFT